MNIRNAILLLLAAMALAACGNKGPLVLPTPEDPTLVPVDDLSEDPAEAADEAADDVPTGNDGEPVDGNPPQAPGDGFRG